MPEPADIPDAACASPEHDPQDWQRPKDFPHAAAICLFGCARTAFCLAEAETQRLTPGTQREEGTTWRPWGLWGGMEYNGGIDPPRAIKPVASAYKPR